MAQDNGVGGAQIEGQASQRAAYDERKRQMLLKLKSIHLSVVADDQAGPADKAPRDYKAGASITFNLLLTNIGVEPVPLDIIDLYEQSRPQLFKNGNLVPYRSKVNKRLRQGNDKPTSFKSFPVVLEQNESKSLVFTLSDWYEPVGEGKYELVVQWRPFAGAEWISAPPLTFSVSPN